MATPNYAENSMPAVKNAGGFQTKLPIKLTAPGTALQNWVLNGVGAPGAAGTLSAVAPANSLYLRTDGNSTTTRMYVSTAVGTWTTVTTGA